MQKFNRLSHLLNLDLSGKTILLRADLNVPMKGGKVSDLTRIRGLIPTITALLQKTAKVIIISHFGRPQGQYDSNYSLSAIIDDVANELKDATGKDIKVKFGVDCVDSSAEAAVAALKTGEVLILENLRFHKEEEDNDAKFSAKLAQFADYYINDAFSCSHRAHASISGVSALLPAYAGLLLEREVECLSKALNSPERPLGAIVGGSKISTKMDLLYSLIEKADYIFIGGGMANTFLAAKGAEVGKSLCETKLIKKAQEILKLAENNNCKIMLPIDVTVAASIEDGKNSKVVPANKIPADLMALDIGTQTLAEWNGLIAKCKTIIWNGPVGAFEFSPFDNGSIALARSVSYFTENEKLNSVIGGGDTIGVISASGLTDTFSYVSLAGGAFLEWLEGKDLPGIKSLIDSATSQQKKRA